MIEWIQHWDEMRFFYWSPLNWLVLVPVYLGGAAVIALVCWLLAKLWRPAWLLAIPLLAVLAIAPIWEELDIAYNFGQLCKKDAGITINRTVTVDGFYNASAVLPKVYTPLAAESVEFYEDGGYRYYELGLAQPRGTPQKVVHIEKVDGVWTPTVLDHPTARYHYKGLASHMPVSHQVKKFERVVVDQQTGDVLGRYLNYHRGAPWFFVHLERPTIPCRETQEDTRKYGSLIHYSVLTPAR